MIVKKTCFRAYLVTILGTLNIAWRKQYQRCTLVWKFVDSGLVVDMWWTKYSFEFLVLNVNNFFLINNEIPIPKTKITRLEWGHANFCNATKTNAIIKFRGAGSRGALVISMTFVTIFLRIILRCIRFL